jgi:hypothetical protein
LSSVSTFGRHGRVNPSQEHLSYVLPVVYLLVAGLLDVVGRGEEDALAAEAREVAGVVVYEVIGRDDALVAAEDFVARRHEREVLLQPPELGGEGGRVLHCGRRHEDLVALRQVGDHLLATLDDPQVAEEAVLRKESLQLGPMFLDDQLAQLLAAQVVGRQALAELGVVEGEMLGQKVRDHLVHVYGDPLA